MKDGAVMPRIAGKTLLLDPFSKSGYRFCVRMRGDAKSTRAIAIPSRPRHPEFPIIRSENVHAPRQRQEQ